MAVAPKKKAEKMNLGEFLTNQTLGSWADEMDSQPISMPTSTGYGSGGRDRDRDGGEKRSFTQPAWESARSGGGMSGGMGGGMGDRGMGDRGASYGMATTVIALNGAIRYFRLTATLDRPRYPEREQLPLPTRPPYTAHLGNLAYDISQSQVEDFLAECQVTSVRIVEDKLDHKPKGFGYVEFATLDGLKIALTKTDTPFMGRNIKISVAEPPKERAESSRDFSDWSRRGPLPDLPQNTRQPSNRGFNRNFDERSDAGSERGGSRRPAFFEGDGKVRDFSNWERKGPMSPPANPGPPAREEGRLRGDGPPRERRQSPAWGEGRSDAGSRPPRREFEPRAPVERAPTAAEQDNQWRSRMRPDASPAETPEISAPTSPAAQAPKERPRLNLAKRTVSTAETDATASSAADSKASPFGAARPIDTAAKERELDEKRQLALRQKQEQDAKTKEEKAAQDAAARAARAERADRGQAVEEDKVTSPTTGTPQRNNRRASKQQNGSRPQPPKENGDVSQKERASFSILRRDAEDDEENGDAATKEEREGETDAIDAPANGTIVGDKETKPQEIVREIPADAAEGANQNAEPTAQAMEDDGWATVPAKGKKDRRAGQRAMAS
ncbi:hypothetical protein BAUCODRAFT_22920 [Baudoinia panamericana UAMH 10762]|uniref:RRM domain-containing protein n=1 Tax=Baudoinia panamericana (strain UAMH 10762) TaxID=717646 RepID=M2N2D9_BAUPA|nr:uncharacterized protein BAUCODRAFT_22920 [Baudoinia panamericana UAMH 10762]EMC98083.1 hypothetical protein BAUCODRAFT_22920 [Baudoinia panamericana UAMH 10762]